MSCRALRLSFIHQFLVRSSDLEIFEIGSTGEEGPRGGEGCCDFLPLFVSAAQANLRPLVLVESVSKSVSGRWSLPLTFLSFVLNVICVWRKIWRKE